MKWDLQLGFPNDIPFFRNFKISFDNGNTKNSTKEFTVTLSIDTKPKEVTDFYIQNLQYSG